MTPVFTAVSASTQSLTASRSCFSVYLRTSGRFRRTANGGMPAYLGVMFGGGPLLDPGALYLLRSYLPALLAAAVGSTPFVSGLFEKIPEEGRGFLRLILVAGSLAVCTAYLVADTYNPFLYFRF